MSTGSGEEITEGVRNSRASGWGQGVSPGVTCGVRTSLVRGGGGGGSCHFCLSTVRHCTAAPRLSTVQGRWGNVPADTLGYSKAQNTASFNYVYTLSRSGRAFKTATQRRQPLNPFAFLPVAPGRPGISHHSCRRRPISNGVRQVLPSSPSTDLGHPLPRVQGVATSPLGLLEES